MITWAAALDDFEGRLDAAAQMLELTGGDPLPAFVPPAVEGELPPELVDRATALLGRSAELQSELSETSNLLRAELKRMPRRAAARGPVSRFEVDA